MFSKINRLESILSRLLESFETTETKRYTANQALKAENINLAEGATLNINMSNMILSLDIIKESLEIIDELKCFLPIKGEYGMKDTLNNYKDILVTRALERTDNNKNKAARLLGLTERQFRYLESKRKEQ